MSPSLNNAGLVFNYLLYEINRVCKSVWFWGVLDAVIVTTLWCGEMLFFVNYLWFILLYQQNLSFEIEDDPFEVKLRDNYAVWLYLTGAIV